VRSHNHIRKIGEALHPKREPLTVLHRTKAEMGSFNFAAQYQQSPVPVEGEIVKWEWFDFCDEPPPREHGARIVQSWDAAASARELSDYSIWLVIRNDYFLIDVFRERLVYPDLKRAVIDLARAHCTTEVLIEDTGSGTALIQEFRRDTPAGLPRPIGIKPEGDKEVRLSAQSAKIEARQVHLPRGAAWLDELRAELLQFPHGRYDDQVDSISQFLNWIDQRERMTVRQICL
jgi:predicted phage terminase large subunit-like protein